MAYSATKPVTSGVLSSADIRENFRALKEDAIVAALTALTASTALAVSAGIITQSKLATSQGSVNHTDGNVTLPGGEYGFYPKIKSGVLFGSAQIASVLTTASYITNIYLIGGLGNTVYAQQRYVTSSGEVFWLFMLKDKLTGDILSMWQSPDHPSFGNGGKPNLLQHPFADVKDNRWLGSKEVEIIIVNPAPELVQEAMFKRVAIEGGYPDKGAYQNYINKAKNKNWQGALTIYEAQSKLKAKNEQEAREFLLDYQGFIIDENRPNRDLLEVFNDDYELNKIVQWGEKVCTVALPDGDLHGSSIVDWRFVPMGTPLEPIQAKVKQPQDSIHMSIKEK